jgi:hypothetical protein
MPLDFRTGWVNMDKERKDIIVKEILYWKDNRMLPEHYCDYLLALYTEGNRPKNKARKAKGFYFLNIILLLLIPLSLLFIYFTELSFILQMGLLIFFTITGVSLAIYFTNKGIAPQLPLAVSGLILLLMSVELASHFFPHHNTALYGALMLNCLLWIAAAWKFRQHYFGISGVVGLIIIAISIFI